MFGMRPEKQGDQAIHDQANPEVDQQPEVRPECVAAVTRSGRQVWHEQEVNGVTQDHCRERDREVSRETHSLHLETRIRNSWKVRPELLNSIVRRNYIPAPAARSGFARSMSFVSDWS